MAQPRDIPALLDFIDSRGGVPHAWGRDANDCVSFVAGAVEAQTGRNPLGRLRWSDKASGLRTIARLGGLEKAFDARFLRIPPAMAQRGDIGAVADSDLDLHPMIVEGDKLVGPGERGNRRLPRALMIAAWRATEGPADE
jgi:hypothetical protein